ncbi:MAG TPA: hypothetical protein VI874_03405 [Candidatus Norongarragalinales archaeon]|nr:hypothetical protein [Candidatus Norongarragalinales archaeon]
MASRLETMSIDHVPAGTFHLLKYKDAFWATLRRGPVLAEGKLFLPSRRSLSDLVIFQPGYAGESNRWFEGRHVGPLVRSGFAVFVLRHVGTKVDKSTESLIGSKKRLKEVARMGVVLGNRQKFDFSDWVGEVRTALHALSPAFERVHLMGHSFGGLGTLCALLDLKPSIAKKVATWVGFSPSLEGFSQAGGRLSQSANQEKESIRARLVEYLKDRYPTLDPKATESWIALARNLHANASRLPHAVRYTAYHHEKDEYVHRASIEAFQEKIPDRFRLIPLVDPEEVDPRWPEVHHGAFWSLPPRTLIQMLRE